MDGMCFHWDNRNTLKRTMCSDCTFSHFTRCMHSKLNGMHMVIYFTVQQSQNWRESIMCRLRFMCAYLLHSCSLLLTLSCSKVFT